MLKAIGKSTNIRTLSIEATKAPIVILGNNPITKNYTKKVDLHKQASVVQGFWSLNPQSTNEKFIKTLSPKLGFEKISDEKQLFENCKKLIENDLNYFSSMITKKLGEIIKTADREENNIAKAERFLILIQH